MCSKSGSVYVQANVFMIILLILNNYFNTKTIKNIAIVYYIIIKLKTKDCNFVRNYKIFNDKILLSWMDSKHTPCNTPPPRKPLLS